MIESEMLTESDSDTDSCCVSSIVSSMLMLSDADLVTDFVIESEMLMLSDSDTDRIWMLLSVSSMLMLSDRL